jgi:hypothetical protein
VLVDTNEDCFDRHVALYLSALQPQSTWKGYNRSGSGSLANSAATIAAIGHYTRLDIISGQFLSLDVAIKYIEYQLVILKSAA